jgi:hypothetical protein
MLADLFCPGRGGEIEVCQCLLKPVQKKLIGRVVDLAKE